MKTTNLLKISKITLLLTSVLLGTTCKKKATEETQPSADFTAGKAEYLAGETIELSNTSSDAATYRWTLPNGTTSKSKDISFATDANQSDGVVTFKLEAIAKGGLKSDYVVKQVSVRAATGQMVLYYTSNFGADFNVTIDGQGMGSANFSPGTTVPSCGQSGFPTYTLKTGTHTIFTQSNGLGTWSGTFEIKKGECTKVKIYG